ncbi:MAG: SDR family oxidoreductase [Pseudomonadales bacterium]
MNELNDKVVFITGASSGLGEASALVMAEQGARIMLAGRDTSRLEKNRDAVRAIGVAAECVAFDVSDPQSCVKAIAECVNKLGQLDVLVNIAGAHQMRHTADVSVAEWEQDLAVNLSGPFFLSQAAIPHLLSSKGNIVNVASIAGLQGQSYSAGYCAAKHGLLGLTKSLALEYTRSDLRVNAVCPGGMETPQITNLQLPEDIDFELLMRSAALRGMMNPTEVAEVIAFLASDKAAAIHGAVYTVDQGKTVG